MWIFWERGFCQFSYIDIVSGVKWSVLKRTLKGTLLFCCTHISSKFSCSNSELNLRYFYHSILLPANSSNARNLEVANEHVFKKILFYSDAAQRIFGLIFNFFRPTWGAAATLLICDFSFLLSKQTLSYLPIPSGFTGSKPKKLVIPGFDWLMNLNVCSVMSEKIPSLEMFNFKSTLQSKWQI